MALCPIVRAYLLDTVDGKLLGGNSASAVRNGHVTTAGLIDYFNRAHTKMLAAPGGASSDNFESALHDLRFAPFEHGVRREVHDSGLGFPDADLSGLAGQTFYHVMKLRFLHFLVDTESPLMNDLDLPLGKDPRESDAFLADWEELTDDERRFSLNGLLGSPIVWFTNEDGAKAARLYSAANGIGLADAFCEVLGLGHHHAGDWMVLLHIPGSAIEKANHYRPLFCDAVTHRYFMAHSCLVPGPTRPWGQTANLRELVLGTIDYDGAVERVSHQLTPSHFEADETIYVEMLGSLQRTKIFTAAPKRLADEVWVRRRAA
ncbi:hypothetical protein NDN01_06560 [Sphingomonas sp. QA11]|uniref:hypothetical protein n=1 Tax=Sphingomonas sp. QA11 TaxID=2950605 RepID=UPI00234AC3CE|nr:hypothetical protein [Sphingomonas sp. QA11]WCM28579.1 hypothetical protein NDN01_06560 [Sphingomonas sp. QA11]